MGTIEIAPQDETTKREREIQILLNIADPDPAYQPLLTDEASLLTSVRHTEDWIAERMHLYFGKDIELPLQLPVWQLVDHIKAQLPTWPDDDFLGQPSKEDGNTSGPIEISLYEAGYLRGLLGARAREDGDSFARSLEEKFARFAEGLMGAADGRLKRNSIFPWRKVKAAMEGRDE